MRKLAVSLIATVAATITGAAFAQTSTPRETSPAAAATSADNRTDVKEEAKSAAGAGQVPKGEAAVSAQHPRGGAVSSASPTEPGARSRAEVIEETRAAVRADEIPRGEAGIMSHMP